MAAVCMHAPTIGALKLALKVIFPSVKSSHMTEAIAFALGYQTHAAMRPSIQEELPTRALVLHDAQFLDRLTEFGYDLPDRFHFDTITLPAHTPAASLRVDLDVASLAAMGILNPELYHICRALQERAVLLPTYLSPVSIMPLLAARVTIELKQRSRYDLELAEARQRVKHIAQGAGKSTREMTAHTSSVPPATIEVRSSLSSPAEIDLAQVLRDANPLHVNLTALEAQLPFTAGGTGKSMLLSRWFREDAGIPERLQPGSNVPAPAKALMDLRDRNTSYTEADLDAAVRRGIAEAVANIAAGSKVFVLDEGSLDWLQNAFAMGWNSQCASEENQRLWAEFKASRTAG